MNNAEVLALERSALSMCMPFVAYESAKYTWPKYVLPTLVLTATPLPELVVFSLKNVVGLLGSSFSISTAQLNVP